MKRQREEGGTYVYFKYTPSLVLPFADYDDLRRAWVTRKAGDYYEGVGFYGDTMVFDLCDVAQIIQCTSQQLADSWAESRADDEDDKVRSFGE